MRRSAIFALAAMAVALGTLSEPAWAQRTCTPTLNNCPSQDVTFSKIQIGGAGSLSSNGPSFSNPGRLDDGTIAEADLEFTFDRTTGRLTLVAKNVTATTATLTAIGFNTSSDVTSMSLISETGALNWALGFDLDRNDDVVDVPSGTSLKELRMDGYGRFNVFLGNKGIDTGGNGGDPTEILAGHQVTFVIQVTGNISNITACSFTSQPSLIPPGDKIVTAVGRFQSGEQGGSGFIGPCTGGSLLVTMASIDVTPGDSEVSVAWTTSSEIDTAGFAVLRKDVRTGRTVRLNSTLIVGRGSEVTGSEYAFVDRSAVNGKKYDYMVEDWDIFDVNTIHAPLQAVPNRVNPPVRLLSPAYEETAGARIRLTWVSDYRGPAVVEISGDATFPAARTLRMPVGLRSDRTLNPAEVGQVRRMATDGGEGGVYWRVTARRPDGVTGVSETFFLAVE